MAFCRANAAQMEAFILRDRQTFLEDLLRFAKEFNAKDIDEAYRKSRLEKIRTWQEELEQMKQAKRL